MTKEREPTPSSTPASSQEIAFRSLRPEAQDILWRAEKMSGKRVQILPYPSLEAWGAIRIARNREKCHILRYNPRYERHLDYLVVHECGHLLRLWSVSPEERQVPLITRKERRTAYRLLLKELPEPLRALPERALADLFRTWHDGIVRQVTSFPADIRIEAWLYDCYPRMREVQVAALVEQLRENETVLRPEVAALTPRTVYRASILINCAFAQSLALLLDEPALCRGYPLQLRQQAAKLLREVSAAKDPGYTGDVKIARKWAELLGLSGWFKWTKFRQGPTEGVSFT